MNSLNAFVESIILRKCFIQKLAEQADFREDKENSERLWGQVEAFNWIINLAGINENESETKREFIKMVNTICEIVEDNKKEGDSK